jgi:hypothetical protein
MLEKRPHESPPSNQAQVYYIDDYYQSSQTNIPGKEDSGLMSNKEGREMDFDMSQVAGQHGEGVLDRGEKARHRDSGNISFDKLGESIKGWEEDDNIKDNHFVELKEEVEAIKKELVKVSRYVAGEEDKRKNKVKWENTA